MVWADPVVDVAGSGTWWHSLARLPEAVLLALPEWGGGDGAELAALAARGAIELDQLSLVVEKMADGRLGVEVRAFGDVTGQATGMIERSADGVITGEILFSGESALLAAARSANPELGAVLSLLANGSQGLRIAFRHDAESGGEFIFPFLQDALELKATMEQANGGGAE
jgi:hypothetical protein